MTISEMDPKATVLSLERVFVKWAELRNHSEVVFFADGIKMKPHHTVDQYNVSKGVFVQFQT